MSFAKLVSLLQRKQLWFSAADLLEDKWEIMPTPEQLNAIVANRPQTVTAEQVRETAGELFKLLRRNTFINCWTASEHESHALWRVFCPSCESVVVQTTLRRLRDSIGLPVIPVRYGPPQIVDRKPPNLLALVGQKRPMFAYENEVRVVLQGDLQDQQNPSRKTVGVHVDWDPERHIEIIRIHPEAPYWFMETVTETVSRLAPGISENGVTLVAYSSLSSLPPF